MTRDVMRFLQRLSALAICVVLTSCGFGGVNSLPLPGVVGRGSDAATYRVEIANVGTLESNSPVLIGDVVVGSVGEMTFSDWHADVELSLRSDVVVPANAVATVGQTSLLGSMHVALDPPLGQAPTGRLRAGDTIGLNRSRTYPSTEVTLSSLAAVVNGGALGQLGDIIGNVNDALSGREDRIRDVLIRLDTFVGTLDGQREDIIASLQALNRLAGTFAAQRDVLARALTAIPPALDVLIAERPRLTAALTSVGQLSDTATRLVDDAQADLVTNLENLAPTLGALADVGPNLDRALTYALTLPFSQDLIDRGMRGDFLNVFVIVDMTIPRLKRTLFLGTRFGKEGAEYVPAPGDPWYLNYTYAPLNVPLGSPSADPVPPLGSPPAPAPVLLPVTPPPSATGQAPPPGGQGPVFAGPYDVAGSHVPGPAGGGG